MKKAIVIVAGGKGLRMGATIPKQFISINGLPILMHTIKAFVAFDTDMQIVLALPKEEIPLWENLCSKHNFNHQVDVVIGGEERFHSVKNGLSVVLDAQLIGVHDGVRPLISSKVIGTVFETANQKGTCIPVVPITSSIRKIDESGSVAVNRKAFVAVQTPQCFKKEILLKAYSQNFDENFTDDASVVEQMGEKIWICKGEGRNIKITNPEDLLFAEYYLK